MRKYKKENDCRQNRDQFKIFVDKF